MSSLKDAYFGSDENFKALIEAFLTDDEAFEPTLADYEGGDVPCPMCREWVCSDPDACEAEYSGE